MGRELCLKLMNKAVHCAQAGQPLGIKSVVAVDHLRDYLYIEAYKVLPGGSRQTRSGVWAGMHWKGRGLRGGPRGGWTGGWRRLPKRLGAVTVGYKCH